MTPVRLHALIADITTLDVDAIVNAANQSLLGGAGVDGAIHAAAGPRLLDACRLLHGCPTGEARITPGFKLPARHVIHTVGPVWRGGHDNEDALLESCYRNTLALAARHDVDSIAFPAISTGSYGFPPARAAAIAIASVRAFVSHNPIPSNIVFCCFSTADLTIYRQLMSNEDCVRTPALGRIF